MASRAQKGEHLLSAHSSTAYCSDPMQSRGHLHSPLMNGKQWLRETTQAEEMTSQNSAEKMVVTNA